MTKYTIEVKRTGSQVRAYGPNQKHVVVTVEPEYIHPTQKELPEWQIERMRELAQAAVGGWYTAENKPDNWFIYTEKACNIDHEKMSVEFIAERPYDD